MQLEEAVLTPPLPLPCSRQGEGCLLTGRGELPGPVWGGEAETGIDAGVLLQGGAPREHGRDDRPGSGLHQVGGSSEGEPSYPVQSLTHSRGEAPTTRSRHTLQGHLVLCSLHCSLFRAVNVIGGFQKWTGED